VLATVDKRGARPQGWVQTSRQSMHGAPGRKVRCSRCWQPSTDEVPDRKAGCRRVGSRLHGASRKARRLSVSTGSFENQPRGSVMGTDSLVAVSTVTQQSIAGAVHVRLAVQCTPRSYLSPGRKGGVRGSRAWHAGLRPSVENCRNRARRAQSYGAAPRGSSSRRYRTASRFVAGLSSYDLWCTGYWVARPC